MASKKRVTRIKPGINPKGYREAVKDYTEPAVIEELAANSYDADASTVLVLLDPDEQVLHIIDDGVGFTRSAILTSAIIGGGEKRELEYSASKRPYLGAYGFGLKSTLNIARHLRILTISEDGKFEVNLDWSRLDEALKEDFEGYELIETTRRKDRGTGTHITIDLISPTSTDYLDKYAQVLGNLPQDNGRFNSYVGIYPGLKTPIAPAIKNFKRLKSVTKKLVKENSLLRAVPSVSVDLEHCELYEGHDPKDSTVKYKIYFTGIDDRKIISLKKSLRGIYVRIQGRLLKHSFTEQKYVYPISKWVQFANGLRVELEVDWLRNEVSLSRDDIKFSNPKLEEQFISTVNRVVSAFIQPQLKKLQKKTEREQAKAQRQRMELAKRRMDKRSGLQIAGIKSGFNYIPESDGELALLVSKSEVLRKIKTTYSIVDYNDKAAIDCVFYDRARKEYFQVELEPTLMDFLDHKRITPDLTMIVTWTLGKWRVGATKKAKSGYLQLIADDGAKAGRYRLLAFARKNSKVPRSTLDVIALDRILAT